MYSIKIENFIKTTKNIISSKNSLLYIENKGKLA